MRGHPQVRRARVEHHVEHLGWRADANLPVVLSLLGAKPEKFMTVTDFPKAAKADCFDAVKICLGKLLFTSAASHKYNLTEGI